MAMTTAHLRQAFDRPAPPAPMTPRRDRPVVRLSRNYDRAPIVPPWPFSWGANGPLLALPLFLIPAITLWVIL